MPTTDKGVFYPPLLEQRSGVYLAEVVRCLSNDRNLGVPDRPGFVNLKLPFTFATADAAVLYTVPTGMILLLTHVFWEITADLTGGASSAIGVSSSAAPHTTKGDLLGGAAGDVAAALTAAIGFTQGTIGVSFSAAPKLVVLPASATIRFDAITSAFTAGAGNVRAVGVLLPA